ncbi:MAG: 3-deoxy-7-phosphoheptulonate synthase [Bacilli bacterium]|jgi:3-deoxy-7-phosphoheptulonate synthase
MIITIKSDTPKKELDDFIKSLEKQNLKVFDIVGTQKKVLGLVGDTSAIDEREFFVFPWVEDVNRISAPYKKANRQFHPQDTIIDVNGIKIGGGEKIVIIAGPCSVESEEQIFEIAEGIKQAGAVMLRGGAYKPRTSPYVFQGLKTQGLEILSKAKAKYNLPIVSEIMSSDKLPEFLAQVDIIQVGARNMQNFELLRDLGKINKPILLKRGLSNTVEEWLMSAEYIMSEGNDQVILCERGIRTFERATRNTLDLSVIPLLKKITHLPIVIDPSHATGHWELVESMALAAIAAGCDGLLIEVHNNPQKALSDGTQSLKIKKFAQLMEKGKAIAKVIGRDI